MTFVRKRYGCRNEKTENCYNCSLCECSSNSWAWTGSGGTARKLETGDEFGGIGGTAIAVALVDGATGAGIELLGDGVACCCCLAGREGELWELKHRVLKMTPLLRMRLLYDGCLPLHARQFCCSGSQSSRYHNQNCKDITKYSYSNGIITGSFWLEINYFPNI